jgi:hypothetical protein
MEPQDETRCSRQVRFPPIGPAGQARRRAARELLPGGGGVATLLMPQITPCLGCLQPVPPHARSLHQDGGVHVAGTADTALARSLVARYFGR